MMRFPLWCDLCARLDNSRFREDDTKTIYYCEAYPNGIPEAVFNSGHLYPKPGDNGLQFQAIEGEELPEYLKQTQEEEDANYREDAELYEELEMSDMEFAEKMKREHGEDWYLYHKPERIGDCIIRRVGNGRRREQERN